MSFITKIPTKCYSCFIKAIFIFGETENVSNRFSKLIEHFFQQKIDPVPICNEHLRAQCSRVDMIVHKMSDNILASLKRP